MGAAAIVDSASGLTQYALDIEQFAQSVSYGGRDPYRGDPSGRDPSGRDPSGRDPGGRDPSRDPRGRDPRGRDPNR